tara:strand:- start:132 stop:962 length:831 start_codon:yes stop_codon:yes gene_type:complete
VLKARNIAVLSISILLTLISNYLGYTNAPFSISATPILIPIIASLLFFISDIKVIPKFLSFIFFIILNDLLIKNFAGGTHDSEGQGWISAFLTIGLFLSLIPILIYFFTKEESKKKFILSALISTIIIYIFMLFSSSFGRTWNIESTYDLKKSKEKGLYLSNAVLSDSVIIYQNDTFNIDLAWIEAQEKSVHNSIFREKIISNNHIFILKLSGPFRESQYDNPIMYKINDSISRGATHISPLMTVGFNRSTDQLDLAFYHTNWDLIKNISISSNTN